MKRWFHRPLIYIIACYGLEILPCSAQTQEAQELAGEFFRDGKARRGLREQLLEYFEVRFRAEKYGVPTRTAGGHKHPFQRRSAPEQTNEADYMDR